MGRKYIRLCTNHQENKCSYPERYDISYLFHKDMHGTYGVDYFDFVPNEKNLEYIKKHYVLYDFTECYHDREPSTSSYAYDPDDPNHEKLFNKLYRESWIDRMKECNWYEPYQEGIWGYTAESVEGLGYHMFEEVKKLVSKRFIDVPYNKFDENSPTYRIQLSFQGRMFTTLNRRNKDWYFNIEWFGRDINEIDYSWGFQRRAG